MGQIRLCPMFTACFVVCININSLSGFAIETDEIESFVERHCYDCHDETATAGLDIRSIQRGLADVNSLARWEQIYDRIASGEMPPADGAAPNEEEKSTVLEELSLRLIAADRHQREVVLRRLNRFEYQNTVRDLFDIYVDLSEVLPDDALAHGFDNIGDSLSVSAEQMQAYLKAADIVLDSTLGPSSEPRRIYAIANLKETVGVGGGTPIVRVLDDGVVLFNSGYNPSVVRNVNAPSPGTYRIKIEAMAVQTDEPVTMIVHGGVWGRRPQHVADYFRVPPGERTTIELVDRAIEANDTFQINPFGTIHYQREPDTYDGPGLFVGDIEIEGPLEEWPPKSRAQLLGDVDPESATLGDARTILVRLLPQAFRRSIESNDIDPYLGLVEQALDEGQPFEVAIRRGLKGVLCSPEFLFLDESRREGEFIDQFAFASRMAYFLWRSLPDEELLSCAQQGRLSNESVVRHQIDRMLNDSRSMRFVESFTDHWLNLRDISFTLPDRKLYPDYDELLRLSMLSESRLFFQHILANDLSILNFVDSDFVIIDYRLAQHYDLQGVDTNDPFGQEFRRVSLPGDSVRGGVLTQAAVLKVTANGTNTSPVIRGAWVLENIVGRPAPSPPPNIPIIEPDIRGASTIREQLDLHRNIDSCASCHDRIDPPGFALESFDVIGGWRDYYRTQQGDWVQSDPAYPYRNVQYRRGPDVDSSGRVTPDRSFSDVREFKQILLEDPEQFASCLTEKLLTFGLGRELGFADRSSVIEIVDRVRAKDFGMQELIHEVVLSESFRRK